MNLVIRQSLRRSVARRRATTLWGSFGKEGIPALVLHGSALLRTIPRTYRRLRATKSVQLFRAGAADFPYDRACFGRSETRDEIGTDAAHLGAYQFGTSNVNASATCPGQEFCLSGEILPDCWRWSAPSDALRCASVVLKLSLCAGHSRKSLAHSEISQRCGIRCAIPAWACHSPLW